MAAVSEEPDLERSFASCLPEVSAMDGGTSGCIGSESALIKAVYERSIDEVRRLVALVQSGEAEINLESEGLVTFPGEKPMGNATALWTAATLGHLDFVKLLLDAGADINHPAGNNSTPLRSACYDGHVDVVKCLLERGASLNVANVRNETPLITACSRGHKRVVDLLVANGAKVNVRTVYGDTALHLAADGGYFDVVSSLIEARAEHLPCARGFTPITRAAAFSQLRLVSLLGHHAKEHYSDEDRANALELLGATVFLRQQGSKAVALAMWEEALAVRGNCPKKNLPPPKEMYDMAVEVVAKDDLERCRYSDDYVHANCMLIIERLLGKVHSLSSLFLRCYGNYCALTHRYEKAQLCWLEALQIDRLNLCEEWDGASAQTVAENVLINMEYLREIENEGGKKANIAPFFESLLGTLEIMSKKKKNSATGSLLVATLQMLGWWMCSSPEIKFPILNFEALAEHQQEVLTFASRLVKLNICLPNNLSILHFSVGKLPGLTAPGLRHVIHPLPSSKVTQLLLTVGGFKLLNVYGHQGNTPLHTAVADLRQSALRNIDADVATAVKNIELLLEAGAHQDVYNACGVSAHRMLRSVGALLPKAVAELAADVLPLQCLAARASALAGVAYDRPGVLPQSLVHVTRLHCNHP